MNSDSKEAALILEYLRKYLQHMLRWLKSLIALVHCPQENKSTLGSIYLKQHQKGVDQPVDGAAGHTRYAPLELTPQERSPQRGRCTYLRFNRPSTSRQICTTRFLKVGIVLQACSMLRTHGFSEAQSAKILRELHQNGKIEGRVSGSFCGDGSG